MKLALVHDHLAQDGGAEQVLKAFHEIFPESPIFVLVYDAERANPAFRGHDIRASFIQRLPWGVKKYQWFLPLMPRGVESYDLSEFDVILSSSSSLAKGVKKRKDQLHICYCHTPTRYLWMETQSYVDSLHIPDAIKKVLPFYLSHLRRWDRRAAAGVDLFIANSHVVEERIRRYYQRRALVVSPPVDMSAFVVSSDIQPYYVAGGRLVAYKRFDLLIDVFNENGKTLKIYGDGPEEAALKNRAKPNIEFYGRVSDEQRRELYTHALAFLHPQEEDCGITPLEAMASGRPVIAYRKGGACETVVDGATGVFFDEQTPKAIHAALERARGVSFDSQLIRRHASQFDLPYFKQTILTIIEEEWKRFSSRIHS